ncbi:MAG: HAMP domain-containing histidine kinase [Robiginitomaculum sp.]|nr:HAMP domain-containing histidine kinase [Robiginitomaculum sp.]
MNFNTNRGLALNSIIWISALLAAFVAAYFKGADAKTLLPFAGVAMLPALLGLILWPFSRHEWVQVFVIFSWIALAIVASFAIAFIPMAILFLCAPAAAALFERAKVVEAMFFAAIFAGAVFYFRQAGFAPEPIASIEQANWGILAGIMATIAFMVGAMYVSAGDNVPQDPASEAKIGFADAYPGAAMKFTPDGYLEMATQNARRILAIKDADIENASLTSLFSGDGNKLPMLGALDTLHDSTDPVSFAVSLPNSVQGDRDAPKLAPRKMEFTLVPLEDGSFYAYSVDGSLKEDAIQALEDAKSSAKKESDEKTLFFAGVSHELRTPLNAIIGFSDMMRSRLFGPLPGKYAEYADLIHDSGQHMLDLVGDVLDMSKVEAQQYQLNYDSFDAADVVRSSIKMVRPSADAAELTLDVDIEVDKDLVVEADRRAVRQILLNLLSNAIKFTPKGGRITSSAYIKDGRLELGVSDTGTGMNARDLEAIGKPYQQAPNAGMIKGRSSGLGLALVKNLTQLHGGDFSITSHPGVGTNVLVSLPLQKPL